jgi:RNA polymerase-binding protein DksA
MAAPQPEQVESLRRRLEQRQTELRSELQRIDEEREGRPLRTPREEVEDPGEQGEQLSEEAVRDAEQGRDVEELREIVVALARIDQGGYGVCVDCGVDIPLARLQAQPMAARCIDCQERFEKTHRTTPRASPLHGSPDTTSG